MPSLFLRQFFALFRKNWIVLSKHSILNIIRCFILPVGYGVFLAVAQLFLFKLNNFGLGTPIPVPSLADEFPSTLSFLWTDATSGSGVPSPDAIMARITADFSPSQLHAVQKVDSENDIAMICRPNFNALSDCYAAILFEQLPGNNSNSSVQYTIQVDAGLFYINVAAHTSDFEKRVLPVQWAIDQAIIELTTGSQVPTPLEWPFSQETNEQQSTQIRLAFINGIRQLVVIAFFICYIGIAYQLPGGVAGERANLLTSHMKAMGLLDSARIISWHLGISSAYLPAWIIVAVAWKNRLFLETNVGLILIVHLLLGLSLASWSFFVAAPFGKSPQLAAISSTMLAILFAIVALVLAHGHGFGTWTAFAYTIVFPPGFYIFAMIAICGFEAKQIPTNALRGDPDANFVLLPLILAALVDVFLWPYLAVLLERRLYDAHDPSQPSWAFWKKKNHQVLTLPADIAISIQNLEKTFSTSIFRRKKGLVKAITDLTLDIPKTGIFVLVGPNGAGKSTVLSILGGLIGPTRGSVSFARGASHPPRGTIGIVPQKNILFPELSCYQSLRVWRAVKWSSHSAEDEDLHQLLRDCDLGHKIHAKSITLSGGQRRKLQLAIGLVGGSQILLIDECTSGVDPLSRRSIWRTLISYRNEKTIVFTTHFLDEADLLADQIAVLAAPGKLIAEGSPVSLKRSLGTGYRVQVTFDRFLPSEGTSAAAEELLLGIRSIAPDTHLSLAAHQASYHLKAKDTAIVEHVLTVLDAERNKLGIASCDVHGSTIEDIFLDLMTRPDDAEAEIHSSPNSLPAPQAPTTLEMDDGRAMNPWQQAWTIFYKRALVFRRSWLSSLLLLSITIAASCIPLTFMSTRLKSCVKEVHPTIYFPLYLPNFVPFPGFTYNATDLIASPPGIISTLGNTTSSIPVTYVPDNATFVSTIDAMYRNMSLGGVSLDLQTGGSLVAWETNLPGLTGAAMLNLATNILFNHALNATGGKAPLIEAQYSPFPLVAAGTLLSLKWLIFFGAGMALFPAFYSLYVCKERRSSVQAMQFSNGLTHPAGMWLGHLFFDSLFTLLLSTIIIIAFATASNQFHGLGLLWLSLILYGTAGALFAYAVSLLVASPLAAFAAVSGYQIVMFLIYLAGILSTLTFAKPSVASSDMTIIHFTLALLAPVTSIVRAAMVSVNLFSLLCTGDTPVPSSALGQMVRYGGPITYLIVWTLILFGILVWVDSGSILPRKRPTSPDTEGEEKREVPADVVEEAKLVANSSDALRVLEVTKSFGGSAVVDDVSFGVSKDTIFALLGPNGAGKTTTFNIIRGDITPVSGDVLINGISVIRHPAMARLALGVCPQFTAIDAQLTVREHLIVYGRLKGLHAGGELDRNVDAILRATALDVYADLLANKLSGGNQRKLSLAIALMGNPSVILIDEFSTGIDAKMKRDMWVTLRTVALGKAVVITTHSMEEASALANKVGIMAKRMLSVGTIEALSARYPTYEVHFVCRNREDVTRAQELMAHIPGSRMADDVATRFEVPIDGEGGMSLAALFHVLSSRGSQAFSEYTVEKASLESVFLKVIRENNVLEEDLHTNGTRWWRFGK